MLLSLIGALAASVCFGVATVLQAIAARSAPAGQGVDPRLLVRLAGQWMYLAGVGLDLLGFVAELAALRSLPLFVVQAMIASSLAVTAVVSVRAMHMPLSRMEWGAVAAVCVGLAMLGASAGHEGPADVGTGFRLTLCGVAAGLLVLGLAAGRLSGRPAAVMLGLVSGLCFGLVSLSARVLTSLAPLDLLTDPATYSMAAAGGLALLFFATALQRGSVTTATAAMVLAETVAPAAIGVWLLHDTTHAGLAPFAVTGFLLALAGSLALARFGEPTAEPTT